MAVLFWFQTTSRKSRLEIHLQKRRKFKRDVIFCDEFGFQFLFREEVFLKELAHIVTRLERVYKTWWIIPRPHTFSLWFFSSPMPKKLKLKQQKILQYVSLPYPCKFKADGSTIIDLTNTSDDEIEALNREDENFKLEIANLKLANLQLVAEVDNLKHKIAGLMRWLNLLNSP